ncbi:MAG: ELM1/GtrOC1 family putative glycosyltransferase [Immundisolibacter sp.]
MSQATMRFAAPPPAALLIPVRLEVAPGYTPDPRPPVRIFLGTEPAQHRAERVFFHALRKVRNPARVYEVYRMTRLPGFAQERWRTGFTNFRFAIPDLAGRHGRAIYNDVDEIYLDDPAALFDLPMGEAGYLALTPSDTAVMLLDCARMASVWTLERAQRLGKKTLLELAADKPGLWAPLPAQWHARDTEYRPGFTKCLHYTALNLQPWHPTPEQYSYHPHPLGELWRDLEREADAAGYEIFSAAAPSPAYADAAARLATAPRWRLPAADVVGLAGPVASVVTVGPLEAAGFGQVRAVRLDDLAAASGELVAAAHLECCPVDDLPWLVDALFAAAGKAVYLAVAPAAADEPANTEAWWRARLRTAARRYPGRAWRLDVLDGSGRRAHGWQAAAGTATSPTVWLLHGRHAGDNAQIDALAAAVGWPAQTRRLRFSPLSRLPGWLKGARPVGLTASEPALAPPWPDLVIAAGRRSASVARWIARRSGGRTRTVLLGRPRAPLSAFDLVLTTPQYGLPVRGNVLHLPAPLAAGAAPDAKTLDQWRARWVALPRPWIALLVGGDRAPYCLDVGQARRLGEAACALAARLGGSVLATTGPRTTPAAAEALFAALGDRAFRHRFAPGQRDEDNPYRALLALADQFVVTGDSASMLAEAAASGKPVAVFPPAYRRGVVARLQRALERRLGLVERAAGSRGTARQQNCLGRGYDRLLVAGVLSRERDVGAVQQALGLPDWPADPAPALFAPDRQARALADAAARVRDLLCAEQPIS